MTPLRFRAWDEKEKIMFDGDALEENDDIMTGLSYGELFIAYYPSSNPDGVKLKIMQSTGLNDKNGKEIYEGDIVICDFGDEKIPSEAERDRDRKFVIRWYQAAYYMDTGNGGTLYRKERILHDNSYHKIIGNIHENPELLSPSK